MTYKKTLQKIKLREAHSEKIKVIRAHSHLVGWKSARFSSGTLSDYNAIVILTDHRAVEYEWMASCVRFILAARVSVRGMDATGQIVKA